MKEQDKKVSKQAEESLQDLLYEACIHQKYFLRNKNNVQQTNLLLNDVFLKNRERPPD
jgi:hypothetical protein